VYKGKGWTSTQVEDLTSQFVDRVGEKNLFSRHFSVLYVLCPDTIYSTGGGSVCQNEKGFPRPPQHLHVSVLSGVSANIVVPPAAAVLRRPLQHLQDVAAHDEIESKV
jgi:hypothetical protein